MNSNDWFLSILLEIDTILLSYQHIIFNHSNTCYKHQKINLLYTQYCLSLNSNDKHLGKKKMFLTKFSKNEIFAGSVFSRHYFTRTFHRFLQSLFKNFLSITEALFGFSKWVWTCWCRSFPGKKRENLLYKLHYRDILLTNRKDNKMWICQK